MERSRASGVTRRGLLASAGVTRHGQVAAGVTRRGLLASAAPAFLKGAPDRRRPNLLFLLTDDHRWDALGCMGHPFLKTPNLDRLAAGGALFENNFCSTAICMTSRASIFTGLLEPSHGISSFQKPFSADQMARTYPAMLRAAGYRTGFIGKYGVGAKLPENAFDFMEAFPGQGHYYQKKNGQFIHLTALQQDHALRFLEGNPAGQPFNLSVSFKAPHVQDEDPNQFLYDPADESMYADVTVGAPPASEMRHFEALPPFLQNSEGRNRWKLQFDTPGKYQRMTKGYYRLLTEVDRMIGNVVEALRKSGQLDNTVIVFTGDNGYFLGEHGLSHKWYLYEESVRTPLIVWDGRAVRRRGLRRKEMSLNIDIAPTLLRFAGLEPPPSMQGRDLAPLLGGGKPAWRKEWFYSHLFEHKLIPRSEGIRTERWAYIRWLDHNREQLFDIQRDPHNTADLAGQGQHARTLEALRARREAWRAAFGGWSADRRWTDPAA
jgi:arylsulfatase A-like enzyme